MIAALTEWAAAQAALRPDIERIGYIGSYARGDWGPGSDIDIVIVLARSQLAFAERSATIDASALPVPADVLVYTAAELRHLTAEPTRFAAALRDELRWVWPSAD